MIQRNQGANLITSQNTLVIIPAIGKEGDDNVPAALFTLNGKPLICHAIDTARQLAEDIEICVSSNDINIIKTTTNYGLHVPFKLPHELYTTILDVDEIILHAIDHYARKEVNFDTIILLSPYSPFCKANQILDAANLLKGNVEMVTGVKALTQAIGQYYLTENQEGYLQKHSDVPTFNDSEIYTYNNAFAILKTSAIRQYPRSFFRWVCKYVMDNITSIFVKNMNDIARCEKIMLTQVADKPRT